MSYILGQIIGVVATLLCLAMPLFGKKWQMLVCSAAANLLFALNLLLIGQPRSVLIYIVAVAQTLLMIVHNRTGRPVTLWENLLFFVLYVTVGLMGYAYPIDLLPIFGVMFHMLSTFQPDEQKTRWYLLGNCGVFLVYYYLVGSTSILSSIITLITTAVALIRYRKRPKT